MSNFEADVVCKIFSLIKSTGRKLHGSSCHDFFMPKFEKIMSKKSQFAEEYEHKKHRKFVYWSEMFLQDMVKGLEN